MDDENDVHADLAAFLAFCESPTAIQVDGSWENDVTPILNEENVTPVITENEELLTESDVEILLENTNIPATQLPSTTTAMISNVPAEQIYVDFSTQPAKRKNPHRERVKRELAYLRQKASDMETQLKALRRRTMKKQYSNDTDLTKKPVWQGVAERQLAGRRQAEEENLRLRKMLACQQELATQLKENLQKRLMNGLQTNMNHIPQQPTYFAHGDDALYQQYLADLDYIYDQVDTVLEETGLNSLAAKMSRTTRSGGYNGSTITCLEIVDVDVIPFNAHRAGRAYWQSLLLQCRRDGRLLYSPVPRPKDTIAVKFRLRCNANSSLTCNLAMRRYIEKERQVMVWRMLSEGEGELTGMLADETAWMVFCDDPSSLGQRALVKLCARMVPNPAGAVKQVAAAPDVEKFTGLYITSNDEDLSELGCIMENLLLEETMGIRGKNQEV